MTCQELLQRFKDALERDEVDLEALRKLANKCGENFGVEALKAITRKVVQFAAAQALWRWQAGKSPSSETGNTLAL
jgi:hypothetical protein